MTTRMTYDRTIVDDSNCSEEIRSDTKDCAVVVLFVLVNFVAMFVVAMFVVVCYRERR